MQVMTQENPKWRPLVNVMKNVVFIVMTNSSLGILLRSEEYFSKWARMLQKRETGNGKREILKRKF